MHPLRVLLLITGFPLETRALAVALLYAIGAGLGGIIAPQLSGRLVPTGNTSDVFFALALGAVLMIVGGLVEIVYGVKAERRGLEGIAKPLTAVSSKVKSGAARTRERVATGTAGGHLGATARGAIEPTLTDRQGVTPAPSTSTSCSRYGRVASVSPSTSRRRWSSARTLTSWPGSP